MEKEDVSDEKFEVAELSPGVTYTFKVAASNAIGVGPFTDVLVVTTIEIGKPKININWFKQSCELAINYCMTGRAIQGNTGEYSVRGWQYWPDRREGQYIT